MNVKCTLAAVCDSAPPQALQPKTTEDPVPAKEPIPLALSALALPSSPHSMTRSELNNQVARNFTPTTTPQAAANQTTIPKPPKSPNPPTPHLHRPIQRHSTDPEAKYSSTNMPEVAQTPAFKKAIEDSRKLKSLPTNDELLEVSLPPQPPPHDHKDATPNLCFPTTTALRPLQTRQRAQDRRRRSAGDVRLEGALSCLIPSSPKFYKISTAPTHSNPYTDVVRWI